MSRAPLLEGEFVLPSAEAVALVPHAVAVKHSVFAQRLDGNTLHVVVPDGSDDALIDRVRALTGMRIVSREAPVDEIRRGIAAAYADRGESPLEGVADEAPVVRAVDAIHERAVRAKASDIHVEPISSGGRVRLRVDGMLRELQSIAPDAYPALVSRIKLLASMDIAERRLPQDGRYALFSAGREFDARVSSMPTVDGERLVIRLLDMHANIPRLETLGMAESLLAAYREIVHSSSGFVAVCGPTGSGKTTTLYATLAERNVESQHLCTVEDPVEVRMSGAAQVQVNLRAGVTFASALRAFLRQDPNVIMLGEMRDRESAGVAISAALAGQMVLSTLHAGDATAAIERLGELGLSRQTLAAGMSAIAAQRLIRLLCSGCKRETRLSVRDAELLALKAGTPAYEPAGCASCRQTGYLGRTGVFELLAFTPELREAVASGAPSWHLARIGAAAGYMPMRIAAGRYVVAGETSAAEVRRVIAGCGAA